MGSHVEKAIGRYEVWAGNARQRSRLRRYGVAGAELDQDKVQEYVGRSLMLVTALSPHIGYDKASAVARKADDGASGSG